jgi:peptidoglycan/xylan/chitin deacetylase (PgdA/CDA1 family)
MSVTRGTFLKSLGKSLPGMVFGGGLAGAAHKLLGQMTSAVNAPASRPMPKIKFIECGPPDGNRIALTFDDGPTPGVTDLILDELKKRKLRVTFFMVGQRIAAAPDLAKRVLAEGHEVGNHTYTHANLTAIKDQEAESEIQKTQDIMAEKLNHRATWFRPPYGVLRQNQATMVARRGMGVVLWNVSSEDWSLPGEDKITSKVLAETTAGSIVLCHDVSQQTANCIGPILDGLLARGFEFATLSVLMRQPRTQRDGNPDVRRPRQPSREGGSARRAEPEKRSGEG